MPEFLTQTLETVIGIYNWFTNLDSTLAVGSTTTVALGAVWVFAKVLRTVVGVLFFLCVLLVVLKFSFNVDLLGWLIEQF